MEVATGQADTNRCLMFVTCKHPYFDPRQPQSLNGLLDFVLESERDKRQKERALCILVKSLANKKLSLENTGKKKQRLLNFFPSECITLAYILM